VDGGAALIWTQDAADAAGNLYGTATHSGIHREGRVFELTPPTVGKTAWTLQNLHSFAGFAGGDGANPYAGLIFDAAGNLYGTTYAGGAFDRGHGVRADTLATPPSARRDLLRRARPRSGRGAAR
jgi:hypothetical protein